MSNRKENVFERGIVLRIIKSLKNFIHSTKTLTLTLVQNQQVGAKTFDQTQQV